MRTRVRLLLLAVAGLVFSASALPASAHTASQFYGATWGTTNVTYNYTSSVPSTWRPQIDASAARWNEVLRADLNFVPGGEVANYDHAVCSGRTGVHLADLGGPGGRLAVTTTCFSGSRITSSNVAFDSTENWYTGPNRPSSNQMDLLSVATHEFGHATGFGTGAQGHFSAGESICANNRAVQTMCPSYTVGTIWQRTLAKHDKHTFKAVY